MGLDVFGDGTATALDCSSAGFVLNGSGTATNTVSFAVRPAAQ